MPRTIAFDTGVFPLISLELIVTELGILLLSATEVGWHQRGGGKDAEIAALEGNSTTR